MSRAYLRNRALLERLKTQPCTDCGLTFPPEAMDFDHVSGVKTANISDLLHGPEERLLAELRFTELVCANCHRLRTQARRLEEHLALGDEYDVLDALTEELH